MGFFRKKEDSVKIKVLFLIRELENSGYLVSGKISISEKEGYLADVDFKKNKSI